MSTLTKISIVVLVVLLLFACPIFIQQAVEPVNWKRVAEGQRQRAEIAAASVKINMHIAEVWKGMYLSEKKDRMKDAQEHITDIGDKDNQISQLNGQVAVLSGRMNEFSASLKVAEDNLTGQIGLNRTLSNHLKTEQRRTITLRDQLRHAQHTIKEQMANYDILVRSVRVLKEQVAEKDTEIANLRSKLEAGGVKVAVGETVVAPAKIEANITAVRGDVASLDIGSGSGVKKNMEFIIFRGADFVAHLRIADVGVTSSAGIIYDATRAVKVNDKAATSLD